jgi:hypothetical protein
VRVRVRAHVRVHVHMRTGMFGRLVARYSTYKVYRYIQKQLT